MREEKRQTGEKKKIFRAGKRAKEVGGGVVPAQPLRRGSSRENGAALVLVLLFLAVLSILAAEFLYAVRLQTALVSNHEAKVQARYVAKAGQNAGLGFIRHADPESGMFNNEQVQLFRYTCLSSPQLLGLGLTSDQEKKQKKELSDLDKMEGCGLWSLSIPYVLDDIPIQLDIYDEQSRLNLNALVNVTSGTTGEPSMTKNDIMADVIFELFRYQALKHDLAFSDEDLKVMILALIDYIDYGRVDQSFDKDAYTYFEDGDRIIPLKNSPLDSVDEIRFLPGMTDELFSAVQDFLTVYPVKWYGPGRYEPDPRVNINTAPVEVIYALLRGTSYQNGEPTISEEDALSLARQIVQEAFSGTTAAGGGGGVPAHQRNRAAVNNPLFNNFLLPQNPAPPRFYRIKSTALTQNGFDTAITRVIRLDADSATVLYFKEE